MGYEGFDCRAKILADFGLRKTTQVSARALHRAAGSTKGDSKFLEPWRGSPPPLSLRFAPDRTFFEACECNTLCLEYLPYQHRGLGALILPTFDRTHLPRLCSFILPHFCSLCGSPKLRSTCTTECNTSPRLSCLK